MKRPVRIKNDVIIADIKNPNVELKLYFANGLFAIDCGPLKTWRKYFYFSKQDIDDNNEKWLTFAKMHLSQELEDQIRRFVKRINSFKVFI